MGNIAINYSSTALNSYFQSYDAGNTGGVKQPATKIVAGGFDIVDSLSPRDNKASNAAVATGAIFTNSTIPGQKVDIALLFNKNLATVDFTVNGSATYTGNTINTGITFTGQSPTGNDPTYSPTFTVSNPTVDTTSTIKTSCNAVGSYTAPFSLVTSQSYPNTSYFTATSASVGGYALIIRLPGNYTIGTISGSFNITLPAGTPARPSVYNVTGSGTPRWVQSTSNITDVTYGDGSTFTTVDGTNITAAWTVAGTITFASQACTTATLYVKYGLITNDYSAFGPSPVTGSLAYSTNSGTSYTTIGSWNQSAINFNATNFSVVLTGLVTNLNQIYVQINSKQSARINFYNNTVTPTVYDVFVLYT